MGLTKHEREQHMVEMNIDRIQELIVKAKTFHHVGDFFFTINLLEELQTEVEELKEKFIWYSKKYKPLQHKEITR